jgi:hypothetical protein
VRQQVQGRAFVGPDPHPAAFERAEFPHHLQRLVAQRQHAARVVIDQLARFSEHRRFLAAFEEGRADLFFQSPDGNAHRRLGAKDTLSRFRKAALFHNRHKKFELR